MPHAVFDHKIDLEKIQTSFKKIMEKESGIIKVEDFYLNAEKNQALLPAIVIEKGNQNFLIEIQSKEDKTTIRLFPGTDPDKTPGVKRSLGLVVGMIKRENPQANIIKTNIEEFI